MSTPEAKAHTPAPPESIPDNSHGGVQVDAPADASKLSALRRLWPLLSRQRALLAGWLLFLVVSTAATLTLPVAARYMIDYGFGQTDPRLLNLGFAGLLGVAAVLALAGAARYACVSLLGERVVADLRSRLYSHLLNLDLAFFERTRSGELVSRLAADTERVQTVVGSTLSVALRSAAMLLGSSVAMIATSPRLAGLTALVIPAVIIPMVVFGRRVERLSKESQDRIAQATAVATETLGAIAIVQANGREPGEAGRYRSAIDAALATARRRIATTAVLAGLAIALSFGAIIVVLWAGAHAVLEGRLEPGILGQFVLYAVIAGGSVGGLTEVWGELLRCAGALHRIDELLTTDSTVTSPPRPQPLPAPVRGELRFEAVEFRYPSRPDRPALVDFDLQVRPGETVALVGPSGAGKSTVFSLLLRFHDPQHGTICIDGQDLRALDLAELRSQLALVPQAPVLFAASAADNIRFGRPNANDQEVQDATISANADAFLRALPDGYDTDLGERGVRLSGGQQQRIAIARAILRDAPILLLDEATSALDAQSEQAVQQALERLMEKRTTIVIAHRLATVRRADRIVVLDQGRIVAQGRHDELIAAGGLYAELARLQFLDGQR